ncbi:MAG: phosphatase PAP2 family protein [Clostridiales bacterium]|jgi:undecaprenyl-diphosphatase|nr:phosphatase PAP2 family protein [Clostridiales bacterium]
MLTKAVRQFICVTLTLFVAIAFLTATGLTHGFDVLVARVVQSLESSILTFIMVNISRLGDWYSFIAIASALLIFPPTRRTVGLPVLITLTASSLMNTILKAAFAVPRPDAHRLISITGYSFPSGHSMNSSAFIGICAVLLSRRCKTVAGKKAMIGLSLAFIATVGFSRIYLGVHNPSDVLAGFSAGFCICAIASLIFKEEVAAADAGKK